MSIENNQQDSTKKQEILLGQPISSIPKFSTSVNFNKLDNGNIIISFFTQTFRTAPAVLIETIIVDQKHAEAIVKTLGEIIKK
ncbi:MAG: hypothetical protein A3F54_03980 [Candidatus Kerfeldbacteria bacterium RIFCSPHIGHO2_12_FULL_48_17]|uniref:Uncharacterized protein n=1 Tax=Candidatus Kerfeldbacteria bacterium RIFCSPHIGHO2_12_FULL_48_17 TaxID=1798542 RepID=A0A1G2B7T7_9BACT|nr:MAG: hypothetical protein A3F54_03980 [Candidatus Kerfeldbacteria bacterium RIFCSPHIGHO2_12_FULL_48_17]